MRCLLILCLISLIAPSFAVAQEGPPSQPLRPDMLQRIAGAAAEALKTGKLAIPAGAVELDLEKASGYRIGPGAVVVVPARPVAGAQPQPLALLLSRGLPLGDGKTSIPPARGARLLFDGPPRELAAFFAVLRTDPKGTALALYGEGKEPLLSVPVAPGAAPGAGIALRGTELLFPAGEGKVAALRLGSPGGRPGDGRRVGTLQVGDPAPDFTLKDQEGKTAVQLAAFKEKKPVVLVFGSYT